VAVSGREIGFVLDYFFMFDLLKAFSHRCVRVFLIDHSQEHKKKTCSSSIVKENIPAQPCLDLSWLVQALENKINNPRRTH